MSYSQSHSQSGSQRTAIITGASRGIGKAVAISLAEYGFSDIALIARSTEDLNSTAREIQSFGARAIPIPCDVSNEQAVRAAIENLQSHWENLDFLFNNAGAYFSGSSDLNSDTIQKLYEVNVFGAFHILRYTVPWLKKVAEESRTSNRENHATVVNLASIAGTIGFAGVGGYCSSKFALRGMSESLHRELEPLGIRVTTISPSWVNTEMATHSPFPAHAMIQPHDIATTVRYLLELGPNVA
ncbi:MAG: SDR family oxidoreductase, partial [Bdellovibrionales bacterium]|nr:SDR family oxidoreductase [Bdellovibrionales bacterium]